MTQEFKLVAVSFHEGAILLLPPSGGSSLTGFWLPTMMINDVNFISLKSLLAPSYEEEHQRNEILSIRGYMSFNINSSGWGTILRLGHVNNHSNVGFSPHAT